MPSVNEPAREQAFQMQHSKKANPWTRNSLRDMCKIKIRRHVVKPMAPGLSPELVQNIISR